MCGDEKNNKIIPFVWGTKGTTTTKNLRENRTLNEAKFTFQFQN